MRQVLQVCNEAYKGNLRGEVQYNQTIAEFTAYIVEDCLDACGHYNSWQGERICNHISFIIDLGFSWLEGKGNCWLFRDVGWVKDDDNSTAADLIS